MENALYDRTRLLVGDDIMQRFKEAKVIIFGLGGVGSWCAEGLVRSGICHLTIVDADNVNPTNLNRQLMATVKTIGRPKAEALRERLLDINPEAEITAIQEVYSDQTSDSFDLESYDYIIDAIDSLKDKLYLLVTASRAKAKLFSAMGAACKVDPTKVRVAEFWKVRGCPLAAAIRKRMHQKGIMPDKKFYCVYDDEVLPNKGSVRAGSGDIDSPLDAKKAVTNGSTAPITAIFGMTLSALVIKDLYYKD